MSVLVKGMEMPKKCSHCPLSHWNGLEKITGCELVDRYVPFSDKDFWENDKPSWCPLVEVPPHGRLGDLDKLEKMFADIDSAPYSCFDGAEPFYSAEDAVHIIRLAPTVIEAEEGE